MLYTYTVIEVSRSPFVEHSADSFHVRDTHKRSDEAAIRVAEELVKWESCYRVILINELGDILFDELGDFVTTKEVENEEN